MKIHSDDCIIHDLSSCSCGAIYRGEDQVCDECNMLKSAHSENNQWCPVDSRKYKYRPSSFLRRESPGKIYWSSPVDPEKFPEMKLAVWMTIRWRLSKFLVRISRRVWPYGS